MDKGLLLSKALMMRNMLDSLVGCIEEGDAGGAHIYSTVLNEASGLIQSYLCRVQPEVREVEVNGTIVYDEHGKEFDTGGAKPC